MMRITLNGYDQPSHRLQDPLPHAATSMRNHCHVHVKHG